MSLWLASSLTLSHPITLKAAEGLALKQQPLFHICFYCSSEISQANHPPGQIDRMAKRRPQLAHGEFVSFSLKRNLTKTRQLGRRCVKANISPNLFPWILKCLWGLNFWNRKEKPFFQPNDCFFLNSIFSAARKTSSSFPKCSSWTRVVIGIHGDFSFTVIEPELSFSCEMDVD